MTLSPDDVQAALEARGSAIKVRFSGTSTATAEQAADSLDAELGSIVKSLCFVLKDDPVIVLAAGDRRVDSRKLAALFDLSRKKVRIANAEQCITFTGYEPGSVPPLGHAREMPIIIDASLKRFETIHAAAGAPNATFPLTFDELVELTGGRVAEIAQE